MAREARGGMGIADRLVLLLAWIATCGLVYLLGFYVGKGMQERRLGLEDRIVRLPVSSQPPAEGGRRKSETEFGFYDKLMGQHGGERAAVPAVTPPVRVATAPAAAPAARVVTAPVTPPPSRATPAPAGPLPGRVTAPPATPPAARVATAPAAPPPDRVVPAPGGPPPAPAVAAKPPAPVQAPARPAPVATEVLEKVVPPPAQAATAPAAAQPAGGGWTVLANPTRNREEADGLQRQLRGRGYDASLVRVLRDGETWYRVQIGRFATSEQASEVMRRLREHEGVSHVFVASE
jgi:cell division septation protein DedD